MACLVEEHLRRLEQWACLEEGQWAMGEKLELVTLPRESLGLTHKSWLSRWAAYIQMGFQGKGEVSRRVLR